MKLLAVVLFAVLEASPLVSIKVTPRAILVGNAIRVTCTVPHNAENRELSAGIPNVQSSSRQLDGEQSRVTHEFLFEHIPCGADEAFCAVRALTRESLVTARITVAGCEP